MPYNQVNFSNTFQDPCVLFRFVLNTGMYAFVQAMGRLGTLTKGAHKGPL